jgi:hypothetical protein
MTRWSATLGLVLLGAALAASGECLASDLGGAETAVLCMAARWANGSIAPSIPESSALHLVVPEQVDTGKAEALVAPTRAPRPQASSSQTIFHEPWWLDAVAPGEWDAVSLQEDGRTLAWWPYAVTRHRGFRVSRMPALAHLLGPVFHDANVSPRNRWLRRIDAVAELAQRLPRVSAFSQTCHPGITDALAFQSAGFGCATQFTAEIARGDAQDTWKRMRDKTRNVIRRATDVLAVEQLADVDEFVRFYGDNLAGGGKKAYYEPHRVRASYEAASQRGQASIQVARSEKGELAAAVYYVWDDDRLWYFLSSRAPDRGGNGAVSLLLWHGIQHAARTGRIFDLDGIAGAGAARFYAGFGADIRPRFAIQRQQPIYALVNLAVDAVRRAEPNPFVVS